MMIYNVWFALAPALTGLCCLIAPLATVRMQPMMIYSVWFALAPALTWVCCLTAPLAACLLSLYPALVVLSSWVHQRTDLVPVSGYREWCERLCLT